MQRLMNRTVCNIEPVCQVRVYLCSLAIDCLRFSVDTIFRFPLVNVFLLPDLEKKIEIRVFE